MRWLKYLAACAAVAAGLVHAIDPAENPDKVDFAITLRAGAIGTEYREFLEEVRRQASSLGDNLQGPQDGKVPKINGIPFLPAQKEPPSQFFDVVLMAPTDADLGTEGQALRVRLRRDNLYIIGYRNENGNEWMELDRMSKEKDPAKLKQRVHWIVSNNKEAKFEWTKFGEGYGSLEKFAKVSREQTFCDQKSLMGAIKALSTAGTDAQEQARSVLILTQMVSESTRFKGLSESIINNWFKWKDPNQRFKPTPTMTALENAWDPMSIELQTEGQKIADSRRQKLQNGGINSKEDIVKELAIALKVPGGAPCKRDLGCGVGPLPGKKPLQPEAPEKPGAGPEKPGAGPKPGVSKSAALRLLSGTTWNIGLTALNCFHIPQPVPQQEPKPELRGWDKIWAGFISIPAEIFAAFRDQTPKIWSEENRQGFMKSAGDLIKAFKEIPDAVKSGVNDLTNAENLEAFEKSFGDLKKAVKEIPDAAKNGVEDIVNPENFEAFSKSFVSFGKALKEIPGAFENGLDDLQKASLDIVTAFQKAPQQLSKALRDFVIEYNKYFPPGSNRRKVFDAFLANLPPALGPVKGLDLLEETITSAASLACDASFLGEKVAGHKKRKRFTIANIKRRRTIG
ncbi:hypothetical protein TWF696_000196 [Orbilia brochopaga]|uniref:rRNA N-glycosylase n=1 Tax=Orbilia brochopaga TaxID=3140254 RepID=A0AAV9VAI5_9PEZI